MASTSSTQVCTTIPQIKALLNHEQFTNGFDGINLILQRLESTTQTPPFDRENQRLILKYIMNLHHDLDQQTKVLTRATDMAHRAQMSLLFGLMLKDEEFICPPPPPPSRYSEERPSVTSAPPLKRAREETTTRGREEPGRSTGQQRPHYQPAPQPGPAYPPPQANFPPPSTSQQQLNDIYLDVGPNNLLYCKDHLFSNQTCL